MNNGKQLGRLYKSILRNDETIRTPMTLVRYTPEQQAKKLEQQIVKLEQQDIKGWIARMRRHYQIKALRKQIASLRK